MTLVRPKVVSDFQKTRVSAERFKWRVFGVGTWMLTLGAGAYVASQRYEGLPGTGEHALSGLQRGMRKAWDDLMLLGTGEKPSGSGGGSDKKDQLR